MSFDENADALYADIPDDNLIKQTLVFRSNPDVKRIVFIVAPSWQRSSVSGIARAVAGPTSLYLPQWPSYRMLDRKHWQTAQTDTTGVFTVLKRRFNIFRASIRELRSNRKACP
jgi:hypothetical protein